MQNKIFYRIFLLKIGSSITTSIGYVSSGDCDACYSRTYCCCV